MTSKQTALYWRKWAAVRKVLVTMGEFSPSEADAERKNIQREALACDKSSKAFTNADLDKVLDAFDKVLVLVAGPKSGPVRADSQPAARLIFAIEQLGLDAPYIETISAAQFGTRDWRSLTAQQLTRFRYTLTARARSKKGQAAPQEEPF